jgi:uncharacterized protein (TIGR02145 family)
MNTLKFIALTIVATIFASCKAPQPTGPLSSTASVGQVGQTIDTLENQLLLYADSTNGDDHAALQRTGNWLQSLPNIQSVSVLDSSYLYFTLRSGLTGLYYLDDLDDSGMSLTRGGHGGGGTLERWSTLAMNTITNNNVLIFAPVFKEFYEGAEFQSVLNTLQNSSLGLNVTVVKDSLCTMNVVNTFGNYGFVIMDTHGAPNGFLIGTLLPDTLSHDEDRLKLFMNVNLGNTGYDDLQAGQLMLARGLSINPKTPGWPQQKQQQKKQFPNYYFRLLLTSNYVAGIPSLSGTVLFANMCYSGQSQAVPKTQGVTTPIQTAFAGLNPISYYGYAYAGGGAAKVSNLFAKEMEDSLLAHFITNTDSTGHCYVQQNGTEYYDTAGLTLGYSKEKLYFKHFGQNNWSYMNCGDPLVDARDGQKYATVCIGNQNWMAQNLNYNAPGSVTYNNDPANGTTYGRLYDWSTVMQGAAPSGAVPSGVQGVCPKGWHVPSQQEFNQLCTFLGGPSIAGGKMKDTSSLWNPMYSNVGATNSSGFSALPGGSNSGGFGIQAFFWSTTVDSANSLNAYDGVLFIGNSLFGIAGGSKTIAQSCRCVKDP